MCFHLLRRFTLAALLAAASTFASSSALADDTTPAPDKTPTEPRWYGYQTLALDGVSLGVGIAGVAQKSNLPAVGMVTYAIGAPIVHVVHGHGLKALADLGMRVGAPIACALGGGIIGGILLPRSNDAMDGLANVYNGFVAGGLIGIGAAVTIDAAFLAREDVPKSRDAQDTVAPAKPVAVAWTPTISPTPGGASAGVAGTF